MNERDHRVCNHSSRDKTNTDSLRTEQRERDIGWGKGEDRGYRMEEGMLKRRTERGTRKRKSGQKKKEKQTKGERVS